MIDSERLAENVWRSLRVEQQSYPGASLNPEKMIEIVRLEIDAAVAQYMEAIGEANGRWQEAIERHRQLLTTARKMKKAIYAMKTNGKFSGEDGREALALGRSAYDQKLVGPKLYAKER